MSPQPPRHHQLQTLDQTGYVLERFRAVLSDAIAEEKTGWFRASFKLQDGQIRTVQLISDEDLTELPAAKNDQE